MQEHFDILIVDDEPVVTRAAVKVLSSEGLCVDETASAEDASRRVERNDYSLVLCDLMLPGIDGIELIDVIQRNRPGTPVVLITGYATLQSAVRAFRHGAFDFIPKPFDTPELIGVTRRGLAYARMNPVQRQAMSVGPVDVAGGPVDRGGFHTIGGHGWAAAEQDGSVRMGLGETFAVLDESIGELTTANVGDDLLQGNRYVRIVTANQSAHRIWAPLSGRVIDLNKRAFRKAGHGGWLEVCREWVVRIVPSNLEEELANLTQRQPRRGVEEQPWSS